MSGTDNSQAPRGLLPSIATLFFGARDPIDKYVPRTGHYGESLVRVAHTCSYVMLVLFSVSSLIGMADESTIAFERAMAQGHFDFVQGLASGVALSLVLCMDIGIIYAAHMLRHLAVRRVPLRHRLVYMCIIIMADLLEAGSLAVVNWRYDPPHAPIIWVLVIARVTLAPLFTVFLALAQPIPIVAEDVLPKAASALVANVGRDLIRTAIDPQVPLAHKVQLLAACSEQQSPKQEQFQKLIAVLVTILPHLAREGLGQPDTFSRGSPAILSPRSERLGPSHLAWGDAHERGRTRHAARQQSDADLADGADDDDSDDENGDERSSARTPYVNATPIVAVVPFDGSRRADTGMSQEIKAELSVWREAAGREILAEDPSIGEREFARRLDLTTGKTISVSTAHALLARLRRSQ